MGEQNCPPDLENPHVVENQRTLDVMGCLIDGGVIAAIRKNDRKGLGKGRRIAGAGELVAKKTCKEC